MRIELRGNKGRGKYAIVDDCDYERVSKYKWFLGSGGYAQCSVGGKTVYMHRFILGTPDDKYTDHKNHDRLDNRRCNIWVCTPTENNLNRGRRGYYFNKTSKRWYASCVVDGKIIRRNCASKSDAIKLATEMANGFIPKSKRDLS